MSKEDSSQGAVEMHPEVKKWCAQMRSKGGRSTSEKKKEAARRNGLAPCREGKHRGRPKKKLDDAGPSL